MEETQLRMPSQLTDPAPEVGPLGHIEVSSLPHSIQFPSQISEVSFACNEWLSQQAHRRKNEIGAEASSLALQPEIP